MANFLAVCLIVSLAAVIFHQVVRATDPVDELQQQINELEKLKKRIFKRFFYNHLFSRDN